MAAETCVMEDLESEKIVSDDSNDLSINDCQKHTYADLSAEAAEQEGEKTRTVWAGQEWKKYM